MLFKLTLINQFSLNFDQNAAGTDGTINICDGLSKL